MMTSISAKTKIVSPDYTGQIPEAILNGQEPVIIKGLVADWKLTKLGAESVQTAVAYLKQQYNGKPSFGYFGDASLKGRFFYDEGLTRLNYDYKQTQIDEFLDLLIDTLQDASPPSLYIASNLIDSHFPTLRGENDVSIPQPGKDVMVESVRAGIWIGNKTTACCHYDTSDNIACCVVGNRRFTLFPPDQIANLYPGPLELNPGGQALSMVNFDDPDLIAHPNFPKALEKGQIAELEPGDALYLPSMWWHQVEALSPFNILVNYWWTNAPHYTGSAMNVLYHALLSLRDKPEHEKLGWKQVFDYYIFGDKEQSSQHLPEHAQGYVGKMDPIKVRTLRAMLLNKLNR